VGVTLCYCRHKAEHLGRACDAPQEICLSLNGGAEFLTRRGFARTIERDEALDILRSARRAGLVQIADNVQRRPTYICNCCACCCEQLRAINEHDLPAVNPSGFLPRRDDEKCRGCTRCARFCPTAAIEMTASRPLGKRRGALKPRIDPQRCIGCGVCAGQCRQAALFMERTGERREVPVTSLERSLRMALERGRLAHLLFDQGESRGAHFLNRAVQALTRLPPADRLLASEQARSRYLQHVLNQVRAKRAARPPATSA
jgi:Pyruvate/2-oxoacid:ferredoxin oxidoreductase delta subunit